MDGLPEKHGVLKEVITLKAVLTTLSLSLMSMMSAKVN